MGLIRTTTALKKDHSFISSPVVAQGGVEALVGHTDLPGRYHVDRVETLPDQAGQTHHRRRAAAVQGFRGPVPGLDGARMGGDLRRREAGRVGGALRDNHLPASNAKAAQRDVAASISVVAADLHCCSPEFVLSKGATGDADPTYLVQLDRQQVFDARRHWIGKINHLPDRLCNLKLTSTGKLVQIKSIAAGDALTFDYGVDYWVYQLSGLELSDWLVSNSVQSNRGTLDLFRRMHDSVLDYTSLLSCDWVKRRPAVWSELRRESWIGDLAEYLEARRL